MLHDGHDPDPVVYLLTTLSLPVFMWRRHRTSFSAIRHIVIPVLGALTLIVPFLELFKPGQPAPYGQFPYVALAVGFAVFAGDQDGSPRLFDGLNGLERAFDWAYSWEWFVPTLGEQYFSGSNTWPPPLRRPSDGWRGTNASGVVRFNVLTAFLRKGRA